EAALTFGNDQAFRAHPVEEFAQRRNGGAVAFADALQPQLLPGSQGTEDDVGTDPAIGGFSNGLGRQGFRQHVSPLIVTNLARFALPARLNPPVSGRCPARLRRPWLPASRTPWPARSSSPVRDTFP